MLLIFVAMTYAQASTSAKQAAAKDTGLDPTEVIGRIEFNYTYLEQKTGTKRHSGILKLETDLDKTTVIGTEIPLASAKPEQGDAQYGIGDISFSYRRLVQSSQSFSTMIGTSITLDTASDEQLGDDDHSIRFGLFNAWRHGEWLLASITGLLFHQQKHELNNLTLSPLVAYQPMGKYLSYVKLGLPYSHRYEKEETLLNAFVAFGKVMPNKDVYSLGSKINISGPDNDDFVLTLGYRKLF